MNIFKKIFACMSKIIMALFYKKKYLTGRWFEDSIDGWKWCWKNVWMQKIVGYNRACPFPVSFRSEIGNYKNLDFDVNDMNNFQHFGCYFQNYSGRISIGKGTYIAPNVGIITSNHKLDNLDEHEAARDVAFGQKCWIGMNAVILPGVTLGDKTIVGAGSVVTKSFLEGNCVIVGNPAKIIKKIEQELSNDKD